MGRPLLIVSLRSLMHHPGQEEMEVSEVLSHQKQLVRTYGLSSAVKSLVRVLPFFAGLAGPILAETAEFGRVDCFCAPPVQSRVDKKSGGPCGGASGSPISASLLLHDTLHCIASSSLLDLDDPDTPSLPEKWQNSNLAANIGIPASCCICSDDLWRYSKLLQLEL